MSDLRSGNNWVLEKLVLAAGVATTGAEPVAETVGSLWRGPSSVRPAGFGRGQLHRLMDRHSFRRPDRRKQRGP